MKTLLLILKEASSIKSVQKPHKQKVITFELGAEQNYKHLFFSINDKSSTKLIEIVYNLC